MKIKLNFETGAGTEYGNDSNAKKAKFQIGDNVRILNYKKKILRAILLIVLKKFLWLEKSKKLYHNIICYSW